MARRRAVVLPATGPTTVERRVTQARLVVVALIGLPGAGKSTIARTLESELGLHRICRDAVRRSMFPRCSDSPAEKHAAFRAVLAALQVNCAMGRCSVLDGLTFSRAADLQAVQRASAPAELLPILVECPPALARERVAADTDHPAPDRTPALVDAVQARFDPPPAGCAVIDARLPLAELQSLAVALVAQRLR
jgi:predicted kinase